MCTGLLLWMNKFGNQKVLATFSLRLQHQIYKIWTYGVQLWGKASNSNIDILERFQSKVLRIFTDAPWYVPNTMIRRDLQVLPVRQEVRNYSITYRHRLENHPNMLAKSLFPRPTLNRLLKRCHPADLQTRF